jgi:hypothetical protein
VYGQTDDPKPARNGLKEGSGHRVPQKPKRVITDRQPSHKRIYSQHTDNFPLRPHNHLIRPSLDSILCQKQK